jgi:hypothetical protein
MQSQTSTNTLPALAPAYGQLAPTFWEQHRARDVWEHHRSALFTTVAVVIFLSALVVGLIIRRRQVVEVPPQDVARAALASLRTSPEDPATLSRITQILRRYLAARCHLPPGELTTAEISAALAGTHNLPANFSSRVSAFLHECDARKFSPATAAPVDALNRAHQIISDLEEHLAAPAVKT